MTKVAIAPQRMGERMMKARRTVNVEHVVFLFLVGTSLISLLGGLTVKIGKDVLGTSSQQRPTRLEAPFLEVPLDLSAGGDGVTA